VNSIKAPRWSGPKGRPDEPVFTRQDVAIRDGSGKEGAIWITYRDGVYDVTEYVKEHPGGQFILQGAGGPVDSFWRHWGQHHISTKVRDALERLRIGRLADYQPDADEERDAGGIWEDEQKDATRIANREQTARYCEMPYCAETKASALVGSYWTSNEAFYVRNHAPVPPVAPEEAGEHVITFCIGDEEVASLSLRELQNRYPKAQTASILQCSGNRGADNIAANGVKQSGFVGGPFEYIGLGLLGNARWGGVPLSVVLSSLMPDVIAEGPDQALHVTFEGLDGYSTSTPLEYIMNPSNDCMLATDMNGVPLPPDHGFPARAVLPGITGARNVKWVSKVTVGSECTSAWNAKYYKDGQKPLQELPMNSVILKPEAGDMVTAIEASMFIQGVAYSGGNSSGISAVEVSADRGQTWHRSKCRFDQVPKDISSKRGWIPFEAQIRFPEAGAGSGALGSGNPLMEIWCRAHCENGECQPEVSAAHGGYFYNGYHKVPVIRR